MAVLSPCLNAQVTIPQPSLQFGTMLVRQNDELNTATSVTLFRGPGGTLRWEPIPFSSSRGDFAISFLNANDFTSGALIASIAQNGRNNNASGDTIGQFYATVSVATPAGDDPPISYFMATERAAQGSEVNIDISFAYFPYDQYLSGTGWISDRGNGLPLDRFNGSPSLALGSNLIDIGSGVTLLDLRSADPTAIPANGVILVNHAKNEDNYGSSAVQADGTWRLHIRDNGSNGTGTEQDPVTFVYVPVSKVGTDRVQALGRVNSDASTDVRGGDFTITKGGVGQWYLTIPNGSADTGTLIVSAEGGGTNNFDNIVSSQWDAINNRWVIESRDIVSTTALPVLENGATAAEDMFSFVFFGAPILPDIIVTSPTEGQSFTSPASFTVTADASDFNGNVAQVEFFRNSFFIGSDNTEPYSVEQTGLDGGRYQYVARATDNDGLAPTSTPVTAIVRLNPVHPPTHTALFFDGLVEHAATAPVPQLGLGGPPTKCFTLECWFRKEGPGATAGSGSGGITVQPLFSKGRGESDNNNTDTNFLVGVTTDGFLAADFEAYPSTGVPGGTNYAVYGSHDPVVNGKWYHAAVAYDGVVGEWKLYLDGKLVATRTTAPGAMPRYDSNHGFAIGAALNTAGLRAGSFFGAIDEVRAWNYARSKEEIVSTMESSVVSASGLVARFGLDEATGTTITSSVGGITGQVRGPEDGDGIPIAGWAPLWVPGAPLTNQAPSLVLNTPKEGQIFRSATPMLISASASDVDGTLTKVEFFDGTTKLAEFTAEPYRFLWTGASSGAHVIRAVATDDKGALAVQTANITVGVLPDLLLTELHSNPSATAPAGAGDYWELTNFSANTISLDGYTWHDSGRSRAAALAWALPAGTSIAAGESIVFTGADPAVFRAWWGLPGTARVIQSPGSPGLGQNDGVALYDGAGAEVFYFSYASGGFTRSNGLPSLGGHAGTSAGGLATQALVWDPNSGRGLPRYMAASTGVSGGVNAPGGTDVGSPGGAGGTGADPATLLAIDVAPASFSEAGGPTAAVGTVRRYGDVTGALTVQLVSADVSETTVPASVVIAAGESSATFDLAAVNDVLADGNQQVLLAAAGPGVSLATVVVTVQDDGDLPTPTLLLTEIQSSQSAAPGAADYWELTNHGSAPVSLAGFTWDDERRSSVTAQAWAFPAGASIAAGESIIITTADPAAFRTWWGLDPSVQVLQTVGAPDLDPNGGVALYDATGRELFFFSYAAQGFLKPNGTAAAGGHAGVSGGGVQTDALVWDVPSGIAAPRYVAAKAGVYQAFQAPGATDVGSPGKGALTVPVSFTLQLLHFSDAEGSLLTSQTAPNLAALVDAFEDDHTNTLIVNGGGSFIPGSFMSAGADAQLNVLPAIGATAPGRTEIAINNLIGVEASAIGHHEWDLGSAVFANALRSSGAWTGAQFPLLALNLDFSGDGELASQITTVPRDTDDTPVPAATTLKGRLVPTAVVVKGGEKIGLVGVTTQLLASLTTLEGTTVRGGNAVNLDVLAGQIQPYVNELASEGINKIVLLSHLRDLGLETALANKLAGVDVIVAAGSNSRLGDGNDVPVEFDGHEASFDGSYPRVTEDRNGTPLLIVSTDSEHTYLGRLVVDFDLDGTIISQSLADHAAESGAYASTEANVAAAWGATEETLETTAFAAGTKGAQVRGVTGAVQAVIDAKDSIIHGYTAVYLEGAAPFTRNQETNLGNLAADASQQALRQILGGTEPIVSLRNAASITGQIGAVVDKDGLVQKQSTQGNPALDKPVGGISQLDVENALRGNQPLMVFETTPAGLKAILEHGVAQGGNQARYPQIGGVQFAWDPDLPVGSRVVSIALLKEDGSSIPVYKTGNVGTGPLSSAPALIRVVTLNGLANGGEGYPIKTHGDNFRYLLANGTLSSVVSEATDFTAAPQLPNNAESEQDALVHHIQNRHGSLALAYRSIDVSQDLDTRNQNLNLRSDSVPPVLGQDTDGDGMSDLTEMILGSDPRSRFRVGERVDMNFTLYLLPGQTLKLVGKIPAGLKFDIKTGRLTGILTGLEAFYDLQVQILSGKTVVKAIKIPIAVDAFPSRLLGNYEALLENASAQPLGIVRVAVTKAGSWSANLDVLGAARRTATGTFVLQPGSRKVTLPMLFKSAKNVPQVDLQVVLDVDTPLITGTHAGTPSGSNLRGMRVATTGGSVPVARPMTAVLDAGAQDGVAYPAGFGWAKGSVTTTGAINLAGELGDGQKVTLSLRLGVTGQSLVWVQPYLNKVASYFGGVLPVPNLGQPAALSPAVVTGAFWFKAADAKELSYDAGFALPLPVNAITTPLGVIKTSADMSTALGLTADTFNVEIDGGALSTEAGSTHILPTALKLATTFALTNSPPAGVTTVAWTGKINKADGALTGTLNLPATSLNLVTKSAAVSGVVLRGLSDGTVGAGLIRVPVPGKKGLFRTSSILLQR
ncbi:Ig-like domain-containing protein [Brevifollis gellanilyticus]|nr:Ig-like domain-containing protein [Brevifollis gellanilyticus]